MLFTVVSRKDVLWLLYSTPWSIKQNKKSPHHPNRNVWSLALKSWKCSREHDHYTCSEQRRVWTSGPLWGLGSFYVESRSARTSELLMRGVTYLKEKEETKRLVCRFLLYPMNFQSVLTHKRYDDHSRYFYMRVLHGCFSRLLCFPSVSPEGWVVGSRAVYDYPRQGFVGTALAPLPPPLKKELELKLNRYLWFEKWCYFDRCPSW